MLYRHTLPLLLLALSFALGLGFATHSRPHAHARSLRPRRNHAPEATNNNSSLRLVIPESPGGQCPRGRRGPPPLSELRTMIDSHTTPFDSPPARAMTCLPASHQPCPSDGDPCSPEGLCAPQGPDARLRRARTLRLENCPHLALFSVMGREERAALDTTLSCCALDRHLRERDALVSRFLRLHRTLLIRSNFRDDCSLGGPNAGADMCGGAPPNGCVTCEEAYRRWVCSQLFVFYDGAGCPVRPCASICHCVEQKCPYFLPQDKPVAGEPSFLCEDPSVGVEDTPHAHDSSRMPRGCCYEPCTPDVSLGRLHEKTNMSNFALCLHAARSQQKCDSDTSAGNPQCLSDPGPDCGCDAPSTQRVASSASALHMRTFTLLALSRTLLLRPRGFT